MVSESNEMNCINKINEELALDGLLRQKTKNISKALIGIVLLSTSGSVVPIEWLLLAGTYIPIMPIISTYSVPYPE
jgi:hypothetical protein